MKKILTLILAAVMLLSFAACDPIEINPDANNNSNSNNNTPTEESLDGPKVDDPYANTVDIKIDVKDFGVMTLELYPDLAPITVENFLSYVDENYFEGLEFHRVMKGFMIQGGDGHGGEHAAIKGEFKENGYDNPLSHQFGVISMARTSQSMDSATSQFFICNADASASLDGKYAAFGKLTGGEDVLKAISDVEVTVNEWGEQSKPVTPIIINSITRAD